MHTPTARNTRPTSFGGSNFRAGNQLVQPARPSFAPATRGVVIPPVRYVRPVSVPMATRLARAIGRRAGPLGLIAAPWVLSTVGGYMKGGGPEGAVLWSSDATYNYYLGFRDTFAEGSVDTSRNKKGFSEFWGGGPDTARFRKFPPFAQGHTWLRNVGYENSNNIAEYEYTGYQQAGENIFASQFIPHPALNPAPNPFIKGDPRRTPQYRFMPDPAPNARRAPQAMVFDFGPGGSVSIRPGQLPGKRPPRRVKETKAARRALVGVVTALTHLGSEAAEVIDTLYFYARGVRRDLDEPGVWRVPRGVDSARLAKLLYVIRHSDNIDWSQALPHVLVEQMILDKIIGRTIGAADNRFRDINDYSVSPQFGPAL